MTTPTFSELSVLFLACFRLSLLAAQDNGPGNLLTRLRTLLGVRYDNLSNAYGSNWLADGLLCIWCNSVWWGGMLLVGWIFSPFWTFALCLPLAFSGATILLYGITNGTR